MYGEYGVNTTIPPHELAAYMGAEVGKHPVDASTQARYYVEAIGLAACQPLVEMLLFFHVTDEPQLERFQTGMYYADKTPKPGLEKVAQVADAAFAGTDSVHAPLEQPQQKVDALRLDGYACGSVNDQGGEMRAAFMSIEEAVVTYLEGVTLASQNAEPRDPGACRRR